MNFVFNREYASLQSKIPESNQGDCCHVYPTLAAAKLNKLSFTALCVEITGTSRRPTSHFLYQLVNLGARANVYYPMYL